MLKWLAVTVDKMTQNMKKFNVLEETIHQY